MSNCLLVSSADLLKQVDILENVAEYCTPLDLICLQETSKTQAIAIRSLSLVRKRMMACTVEGYEKHKGPRYPMSWPLEKKYEFVKKQIPEDPVVISWAETDAFECLDYSLAKVGLLEKDAIIVIAIKNAWACRRLNRIQRLLPFLNSYSSSLEDLANEAIDSISKKDFLKCFSFYINHLISRRIAEKRWDRAIEYMELDQHSLNLNRIKHDHLHDLFLLAAYRGNRDLLMKIDQFTEQAFQLSVKPLDHETVEAGLYLYVCAHTVTDLVSFFISLARRVT